MPNRVPGAADKYRRSRNRRRRGKSQFGAGFGWGRPRAAGGARSDAKLNTRVERSRAPARNRAGRERKRVRTSEVTAAWRAPARRPFGGTPRDRCRLAPTTRRRRWWWWMRPPGRSRSKRRLKCAARRYSACSQPRGEERGGEGGMGSGGDRARWRSAPGPWRRRCCRARARFLSARGGGRGGARGGGGPRAEAERRRVEREGGRREGEGRERIELGI